MPGNQEVIHHPRHVVILWVAVRLSVPDALDGPLNFGLALHIGQCAVLPRSDARKGIRRKPQPMGRTAECPNAEPVLLAVYWIGASCPVAVAGVGALFADHRVFVNATMTALATSAI